VGCGYGDFLRAGREAGWEVFGIEINPTMRAETISKRIEVLSTPITDSDPPSRRFDCITYLNVLDSIRDPVSELAAVTRWMAPGGKILIRVPNGALHGNLLRLTSFSPHLLRHYLRMEKTPLNAWIFHARGMRSALKKTGFQEISIVPSKSVSGNPVLRGLFNTLRLVSSESRPLSTSIIALAQCPSQSPFS